MTDLVAWLRQQFDTDERLALECIEEVGAERIGDTFSDDSGTADRDAFPYYPWGSRERELAFMAGPGHPARVLRQVQAHRAILDHLERELADHGGDNPWWYADRLTPILRALASIYSDRDGYNPDWSA